VTIHIKGKVTEFSITAHTKILGTFAFGSRSLQGISNGGIYYTSNMAAIATMGMDNNQVIFGYKKNGFFMANNIVGYVKNI
jgi:hypothetical protein